jgi:hypothetical protein
MRGWQVALSSAAAPLSQRNTKPLAEPPMESTSPPSTVHGG